MKKKIRKFDHISVNFYHIFREKNKIADALVNDALDEEKKQKCLL